METKKIIYYLVFFFIFILQSGILYILIIKPSILYVIQSFLGSSLAFCCSGGFIMLYIGVKKKEVEIRLLGLMLIVISIFGLLITPF